MPQLPSGRHIGIAPAPLAELFREAQLGLRVHELWSIRSLADLWLYIDIIWLERTDDVHSRPKGNRHSMPIPEQLAVVPSGCTVDQLEDLWADWAEADRLAFTAFMEGRGRAMGEDLLTECESLRQRLLADPLHAPGIMATMLKLGIHPCQDPPD